MSAPHISTDGASRASIDPPRLDPATPGPLDALAGQLATDPDFASLRHGKAPSEAAHEFLAAIAARLRRACGHLSDEAFASLVLDIARTNARFMRLEYEQIERSAKHRADS